MQTGKCSLKVPTPTCNPELEADGVTLLQISAMTPLSPIGFAVGVLLKLSVGVVMPGLSGPGIVLDTVFAPTGFVSFQVHHGSLGFVDPMTERSRGRDCSTSAERSRTRRNESKQYAKA